MMHGKIKALVSFLSNVNRVLTRAQENSSQQFLLEMMRIFLPRMLTLWNIYLNFCSAQKMSMARERKQLRFDLLLGKFQRQQKAFLSKLDYNKNYFVLIQHFFF
ncbi:hypothetical protein CsSME_00003352 [Camellia sinensis var. sinensis]